VSTRSAATIVPAACCSSDITTVFAVLKEFLDPGLESNQPILGKPADVLTCTA
jgi:hypothetical protein